MYPINIDIAILQSNLREVERKMRTGVAHAEERLGIIRVCAAFQKLAQAQEALRELQVAVAPEVPQAITTPPEELMRLGYM